MSARVLARCAALLLGLGLAACGDRAAPSTATPPTAEFLVAAGDSTYWVRADSTGVRVRSAPLLLAFDAERLHTLRISEDITDYLDAEFVQERLYAQPLLSRDSSLVVHDTLVARAHRLWQTAWPDEVPVLPDEEDEELLDDPAASAADFIEVIDVHGHWVSWAHAVDIDVAEAGPHLHRRRRGVSDVRTGARATLDSLVSPAEAERLRVAGAATLDTLLAAVAQASDDRARRAQSTLHTFAFDAMSFTLTDVDRQPAVLFHVAGEAADGEALELLLPPLVLAEVPAWWAGVAHTLPAWRADSLAVTWRHGAVQVSGEADSARTRFTLVLQDSTGRGPGWPIAVVPMPVYQFMALDALAMPEEARAALRLAFDRATADDPAAQRAMHPTFRPSTEYAMHARPARPVSESSHVSSELIMPQDANILGHVFGGAIMAMVDKAAAVAAFRHARTNCVTASIDRVDFKEPIHVGELVSCHASVNFVGTTSMEVGVRVEAEDLISGIRRHTNTCYLTFVAIDRNGRPVPIPQVVPETAEQERRYAAAQERRRRRLEERQAEARQA